MVKRVIAASIGLLLVGAVVAALAGAALVNTAEAQGPRGGGGRWAAEAGSTGECDQDHDHDVAAGPGANQSQGWGQGQSVVPPETSQGQGQGQGQGVTPGQGQGRNREPVGPEVTHSVLRTVSGVVTVVSFEPGQEPLLVIQTGDGATVEVELGPEWYIEQQGFAVNVGDQLTVLGHYDSAGSKLVAHTITNVTTGTSTFFRDGTGRPAWAGRGRRQSNPTAPTF